jgi:hypothetical protein
LAYCAKGAQNTSRSAGVTSYQKEEIILLIKIIQRFISIIRSIPYRILKFRLKQIYEKNTSKSHPTAVLPEPADAGIIELGRKLRDEVLKKYQNKYKNKAYRFLFQFPPNGVGVIWFKDLMQTLEYTGIRCECVQWNDPSFRKTWESFQPNVFISLDIVDVLKSLDLDFITQYKKDQGLLRLFTPINKRYFPKPGMSMEDKWRLQLALDGRSVDAYFCMFVDEFYDEFWNEWKEAGFQFLSLPHGCNPIYQYPRTALKDLDFFMVATSQPERVVLTWYYLKPVFEKYQGLWAGDRWGFGIGALESEQLPDLYARTKIAPAPLLPFLIDHSAEITERAFSTTASGAFLITNWTPVTERFFHPDELVTVKNNKEFLERFEHYVNHPVERNIIIRNGLYRVFSEHTYFHRIDRLIEFLEINKQLF